MPGTRAYTPRVPIQACCWLEWGSCFFILLLLLLVILSNAKDPCRGPNLVKTTERHFGRRPSLWGATRAGKPPRLSAYFCIAGVLPLRCAQGQNDPGKITSNGSLNGAPAFQATTLLCRSRLRRG